MAAEGFEVTAHGLRKLGFGTMDATGAKTPGTVVGILSLVATHNPLGLIDSTGIKYTEKVPAAAASRAGPGRPQRKSPMC